MATSAAGTGEPPLTGKDVSLAIRPDAPKPIRYYPEAAQKAGVEGSVVGECRIAEGGALTDCAVISETPEGAGFGAAWTQLFSSMAAAPKTPGQEIVGRQVRIPMRFALPEPKKKRR